MAISPVITPAASRVHPSESALDPLTMLEWMILARRLDERMWALQRQGLAPFVVSCQGQEATQVGAAVALTADVDFFLPYYRDVGVVLVAGMTPREVMLGFLGRAADPSSGGRQMPGHYGHARRRIITGSSPVATQVAHAAGIVLAARMKGEQAVALVSFGEGSTSAGIFHEGVNFAAVHRLPVILLCENNGYAISVPLERQASVTPLSERARAYGIAGVTVDGMDPVAVYQAAREAVDRGRSGGGPTLIDAVTYRLTPHSSDDDDSSYRSPDEVAAWRLRDPLVTFRAALAQQGILTDQVEQALEERVRAQVDDATDHALAAPVPRAEDALRHVYA